MSSAMKEKNLFPVSKAPMNDKVDSCVFYVLSLISRRLSPIFLVFWQKIMRLAGYWQKKKISLNSNKIRNLPYYKHSF